MDVSGIFKKDHITIHQLIVDYTDLQDNGVFEYRVFQKLKWEIERHFFLEEKALFLYLEIKKGEKVEITEELIAQHDNFLNQLKEMELAVKGNKLVDILLKLKRNPKNNYLKLTKKALNNYYNK